jgi:hypothetical protein
MTLAEFFQPAREILFADSVTLLDNSARANFFQNFFRKKRGGS